MGEEKKIFDKPMHELREAFVRARFAQEDVFGRADVEEWLKAQRNAERPEYDHDADESHWNAVLCTDGFMWRANAPLTVLREHATSAAALDELRETQLPPEESPFEPDVLTQFIPLFQSFLRAHVYYGHTYGAIIVALDRVGQPHPYTVRTEGARGKRHLVVEPLTANALRASLFVTDVLFAEWLYGHPSWKAARTFLCDALSEEVRRERAKAEADFDTAVAVSADGTKIDHADWVVVLGQAADGSQDLKFPASAFREQKILRTGSCGGLDEHMGRSMRYYNYRTATEHTRAHAPEQRLVCVSDGRVLLVHRSECPSLLPEGGIEVTV